MKLNPLLNKVFIALAFSLSLLPTTLLASPASKRVVVLELSLLDETLALGITPVGIASNQTVEGSNPAYLDSKIQSTPSVGTRQQPNLEKILSLKPDLIIADSNFQAHLKHKLKTIAPTVMMNGILGTPQQQMNNLLKLGKIFHREQRAQKIVARFERDYKKMIALGQKHKATVLIGFAEDNGLFNALTKNAIATSILQSLGKTNLMTHYAASQAMPITVEKILADNPDSIILLVTHNDDGIKIAKRLMSNPLWSQLKAVKNHHVYIMSRNLWAIDHGVYAMTLMLQQAHQSGFITLSPSTLNFNLATS